MLGSLLIEATFVQQQVNIVQRAMQRGLLTLKGWGISLTSPQRHVTAFPLHCPQGYLDKPRFLG